MVARVRQVGDRYRDGVVRVMRQVQPQLDMLARLQSSPRPKGYTAGSEAALQSRCRAEFEAVLSQTHALEVQICSRTDQVKKMLDAAVLIGCAPVRHCH